MKTITEFSGFTLKDALSKKSALIAEGKSEDEAQVAINEQLKLLDETKVTFFKNAVDMCKSRLDQVKRIVVAVKSSDTEKVPEMFSEREGNFYLIEYFPQNDSSARGGKREGRDFKGGDRGRGRGHDRGRSGERSFGGDRSSGGNRPERTQPRPNQDQRAALQPSSERKPRPPRGPKPAHTGERKPRPPQANRGNQGPKGAAELRLVLKGQGPSTLQGSGVATPAVEKPSSETPQA
jgi:hypothetical protein